MNRVILLSFSLLLITSCAQKKNFQAIPTAKSKPLLITPSYLVFHENETESKIYVKVNQNEIGFALNQDSVFQSYLSIDYVLNDTNNKSLDSNHFVIKSEKNVSPAYLESWFKIPVQTGTKGTLKISLSDKINGNKTETYLNIDKSSLTNGQGILLKRNNQLVFENYVNPDSLYKIVTNTATDQLFITYYDNEFDIALPPYSTYGRSGIQITPLWTAPLQKDNEGGFGTKFIERGVYLIRTDSTNKEGLFIYNYGKDYPKVTSPENLLQPIRYLTSKYEFDNLEGILNKKNAVDQFWLATTTSNFGRGKKSISLFYNRVQLANQLFASFEEGWKTDRGLILIIYGIPDFIQKFEQGEIWIYGEEHNSLSTNFRFTKLINPLTDNDYILVRNANYRTSWQKELNKWRSGNI